VLTSTDLAVRPGFAVSAVTCRDDHKGWSAVESPDGYRVVLVTRGRFRRRADGVLAELDPTVAYVGVPGQEERFAHPAGGDICTSISLGLDLWRTVAGETALRRSTVYIDARLDLAHRRLLAAARAGEDPGELVLELVDRVVRQVGRPVEVSSGTVDRDLVADARRVIADEEPAADGLFPLAERLGVSPYRLSRAFTGELGESLTRYRNRVRVGRALDRLEAGEASLAGLAADLGFADQAHLTRTMRAHLGHTPTAVRRLLARGTH
jgi:AraC-like DNA-binding protein